MKSFLKSKYSLTAAGVAFATVLSGCTILDAAESEAAEVAETTEMTVEEPAEVATEVAEAEPEAPEVAVVELTAQETLAVILAAQPEEVQARYGARNPAETLAFFGIEPGMKVAEALPGGGWYSKILLPYLGEEGALIGAQYPDELYHLFGFGEEWATRQIERSANWAETASGWGIEGGAKAKSYPMTAMPEGAADKLDAVLFIRALHNLNRFTNEDTDFMGDTISESFRVLKPGGIVGVVQHSAPEANSDEWASGANGYLKKSAVIAAFEAGGFEFVGSSDINANANDVPTEEDFVWRLPPSLSGTEEGTPERAANEAIGESNRMTLKFRKPA